MANDPKNLIFGAFNFRFQPTTLPASPSTAASYTIDFGNQVSSKIIPESTKKEHLGIYKGVKKRDRVWRTEKKVRIEIVLDELSPVVLAYFFGAATGVAPDFAKTFTGFGYLAAEQENEPVAGAGAGIIVWHSFKCDISFEGELALDANEPAQLTMTVDVDLGTPGIYTAAARPVAA